MVAKKEFFSEKTFRGIFRPERDSFRRIDFREINRVAFISFNF